MWHNSKNVLQKQESLRQKASERDYVAKNRESGGRDSAV